MLGDVGSNLPVLVVSEAALSLACVERRARRHAQ
jgi:hypothetical protein